MNSEKTLSEITAMATELKEWLLNFKKTHFPYRSFVKVTNPRFHGYGFVVCGSEEPHQLAVQLQNGNTWWYEMVTCERVTDLKEIPQEVRRLKMKWAAYKILPGYGPRKKLP